MKEYHEEAIRLGLNCLYMTDHAFSQTKQELYLYCLQHRRYLTATGRRLPHVIAFQWGKKCDSLLDPPDNPDVEGGAS